MAGVPIVVDPFQLTSDIAADTISLALPGLLWALLFLLAWEHTPFAESIGFGRWAFWLLLPGALLATFALLPIAPVSYDWVAVSFAGAIFPLLVGAFAFGRAAPPRGRSLAMFLAFLAVESATLFVLVLPVADPLVSALAVGGLSFGDTQTLLVVVVSAAWAAVAFVLFAGRSAADSPGASAGTGRVIGFSLILTGGVLASTFAATAAIPGVGIVESFPEYLVPPILAGLLAALFAPRVVPGREGLALPIAYYATTFGVLLGADLLRQPPLYGTGPAGLYTIGGAGVLDLVYLSGLLALAAAYVGHVISRRGFDPVGPSAGPTSPNPVGLLVLSFRRGVRGELGGSVDAADQAARSAAQQAHRLLDLPAAPDNRPWQGIAVPGWVVADQANLDAIAAAGTTDPRDGYRAWLTARWLVNLGRELSVRRFGSIGARASAFALDLVIVLAPAVAIWAALVLTTSGGLIDLLDSVAYNAAIYGFIAVAFLYFALFETLVGTSPGKRLLHLAVRDREMRFPTFPATLVRNTPLLPILTLVGIGGGLVTAFLLRASAFGSLDIDGITIPAGYLDSVSLTLVLAAGVGLLGVLGLLVIALTSERQRLGDLWAGTWVVRAETRMAPPIPAGPLAAPPSPPPPPPPEPVRSG